MSKNFDDVDSTVFLIMDLSIIKNWCLCCVILGKKNFLSPSHLIYGFGFLFKVNTQHFFVCFCIIILYNVQHRTRIVGGGHWGASHLPFIIFTLFR